VTDTLLLREIIRKSGYKLNYIANCLGLSPYGFSRKLNNQSEFTISEVDRLCELLHIDSLELRFAIFFASKVDAKSTA